MKSTLSTEPYKGVRDFYPADWAVLSTVFARIRDVLGRYGYEEYNASPLERAELYEAKTSEEIVNEQTYTFTDRGDRRVTLRPEMTPTLARMVAAKRRELALPVRWFNIGNRFRYERPQKGRLREFFQLDVDLLGVKDARADGEVVVVAHAILTAFGAKNDDFVIRLNSRTLLDAACRAAGLFDDKKKTYLRLLDRKDKMSSAEYSSALAELTETDPLEIIASSGDSYVRGEKEKLDQLIRAFNERGMTNVVFDSAIVRGFDYYTGIVFEIFDTNPENARAIFGGGRYDNLISLFGGDPIPAVGFGMGDVTLVDFLTTHNLLPPVQSAPELYLGTPTEEDLGAANQMAEKLRSYGLRVFVNLTNKSLGDQVKDAVRRGIPYFAAVGSLESSLERLKVKRLATSEERELPADGILSFIR